MSERYWVICFYDEAAGQASDFATLGEAQAACVGIGLCKQNAMGFVYDVEADDVCWPTDDDVADTKTAWTSAEDVGTHVYDDFNATVRGIVARLVAA